MAYTPAFKNKMAQNIRNTADAALKFQDNIAKIGVVVGAGSILMAPLYAMGQGGVGKSLKMLSFGAGTLFATMYSLKAGVAVNNFAYNIANQISPAPSRKPASLRTI